MNGMKNKMGIVDNINMGQVSGKEKAYMVFLMGVGIDVS
jgi:hypothetical protein